jgi:hypothetical protein
MSDIRCTKYLYSARNRNTGDVTITGFHSYYGASFLSDVTVVFGVSIQGSNVMATCFRYYDIARVT